MILGKDESSGGDFIHIIITHFLLTLTENTHNTMVDTMTTTRLLPGFGTL